MPRYEDSDLESVSTASCSDDDDIDEQAIRTMSCNFLQKKKSGAFGDIIAQKKASLSNMALLRQYSMMMERQQQQQQQQGESMTPSPSSVGGAPGRLPIPSAPHSLSNVTMNSTTSTTGKRFSRGEDDHFSTATDHRSSISSVGGDSSGPPSPLGSKTKSRRQRTVTIGEEVKEQAQPFVSSLESASPLSTVTTASPPPPPIPHHSAAPDNDAAAPPQSGTVEAKKRCDFESAGPSPSVPTPEGSLPATDSHGASWGNAAAVVQEAAATTPQEEATGPSPASTGVVDANQSNEEPEPVAAVVPHQTSNRRPRLRRNPNISPPPAEQNNSEDHRSGKSPPSSAVAVQEAGDACTPAVKVAATRQPTPPSDNNVATSEVVTTADEHHQEGTTARRRGGGGRMRSSQRRTGGGGDVAAAVTATGNDDDATRDGESSKKTPPTSTEDETITQPPQGRGGLDRHSPAVPSPPSHQRNTTVSPRRVSDDDVRAPAGEEPHPPPPPHQDEPHANNNRGGATTSSGAFPNLLSLQGLVKPKTDVQHDGQETRTITSPSLPKRLSTTPMSPQPEHRSESTHDDDAHLVNAKKVAISPLPKIDAEGVVNMWGKTALGLGGLANLVKRKSPNTSNGGEGESAEQSHNVSDQCGRGEKTPNGPSEDTSPSTTPRGSKCGTGASPSTTWSKTAFLSDAARRRSEPKASDIIDDPYGTAEGGPSVGAEDADECSREAIIKKEKALQQRMKALKNLVAPSSISLGGGKKAAVGPGGPNSARGASKSPRQLVPLNGGPSSAR